MDSSVRIRATATQALSRFSLDAAVDEIETVTVQGEPARFAVDKAGEKLDITPRQALGKGRPFEVNIAYRVDRSDNRTRPGDPTSPAPRLTPWVNKKDGFVVFGRPDRAHMFFPANDYPTDRARFTFRVTAPKDLQAEDRPHTRPRRGPALVLDAARHRQRSSAGGGTAEAVTRPGSTARRTRTAGQTTTPGVRRTPWSPASSRPRPPPEPPRLRAPRPRPRWSGS